MHAAVHTDMKKTFLNLRRKNKVTLLFNRVGSEVEVLERDPFFHEHLVPRGAVAF